MSQILMIVKVDDNLVHYDERDIVLTNSIYDLEFVKAITIYKANPKKEDWEKAELRTKSHEE